MSSSIPYLECEIGRGCCSVIEAAAGTGKTYNITNIVARIIMERSDITIDNMVIVTYTRAAAGELKTRISQRLSELETRLASGEISGDDLLQKLLEGSSEEQLTRRKKEISARLRLALLNLDRAMIGTIHSFAMRALSENGFDSSLKLGFTLNEGTPALVSQLINDYMRSLFYRKDASVVRQSLAKADPHFREVITSYVFKRLSSPDIRICWPPDLPEPDSVEELEEMLVLCREHAEMYGRERKVEYQERVSRLEEVMLREKELKKIKELKEELQSVKDEIKSLKAQLKKFDSETINEQEKILSRPFAGFLKHLCQACFTHVSDEYRRLCEEKNFLGNDDLILQMKSALCRENSPLALRLREKFPVGLIDEFQDTNGSQFAIFRELFLNNPQSTFIVVGDPRQAIYRFRDGDINTYLDAKEEMLTCRQAKMFQMTVNHRSGKKYIDAVNAIFTPANAFAAEALTMPQQSACADDAPVLWDAEGKEIEHPIQAAVNKSMSIDDIFKYCAADVYNLLKGGFRLPATSRSGSRPVEFGDIAILTNCSWSKAQAIKAALQSFGIPARLLKNPNVFKTPEAGGMQLFLEGILSPDNRDSLLRALITPLGDLELQEISNTEKIELCAARFRELNELWHKHSFMVMYNELLIKFKVCDRLSAQGKERALSNFNTIADILSEESFTLKLPPGAVLRSLEKHIKAAEDTEKESFPGRPETDQGMVVIDTIFGSKGLSYPVVFLPDLFYTGQTFYKNKVSKTFHSEDQLCYAPFMEDHQLALEKQEILAESLRKSYVAFTRAKYFCRFYYGKSSSRCSALDWLFHDHGLTGDEQNLTDALTDAIKKNDFLRIPVYREDLSGELPDGKFEAAPAPQLRRPDLLPRLLSPSGYLSFTSITPHGTSNSVFNSGKDDEGDTEEKESNPAELRGTMALPAGTAFGNAIHKIMELCPYNASLQELAPSVTSQLNAHGLSGELHGEVTAKMLYQVLNTPLDDGNGGTFKLSEIPPKERMCEFEFLYEFSSSFNTRTLFEYAGNYFKEKFELSSLPGTEENAAFETGFFNGSIDLFFRHNGKFYIIDWKSNKLDSPGDYENGKLKYAMAKSRYYLQYMIYTTALVKYLKQRLPGCGNDRAFYEKYVGGISYIFVRGFTGVSGRGVFSDRLPFEVMEEINRIIG